MGRSWVAWIPARYLSLVWIVGLFLAINGIVRIGLTAFGARSLQSLALAVRRHRVGRRAL